MAIYEITSDRFRKIDETSFSDTGLREREDIQRLLRGQIDIVSPDTLIIAEEFSQWHDSSRRIDLLGIDKNANVVVIELKRTDDGGHMELQAIRYAAMIAAMTFDRAVEVYTDFLQRTKSSLDARASLLEFLDWGEPDEDRFAQDVRIVLVSAEFTKYDVIINGKTSEHLAKRAAIYTVVRHLSEKGHSPEEIAAAVPSRQHSMFRSANGKLNSDQFIAELTTEAGKGGRPFQEHRVYCAENELLHHDGQTYAFTNQWGAGFLDAMDQLIAAFPGEPIAYRASP